MVTANRYRNGCLVLVLLLVAPARLPAQENWPQFRGADARGVAVNSSVPDRWSATENVLWKTDIAGRGWSSPVVWNDYVFLTTAINSAESEEAKKGLYFGGDRPQPPQSPHQWKVVCLDLNSGDVRWERLVHEGIPESPIHIKSSYASETPVTDGQRVYCCFGNVGIYCLDFAGDLVWTYEISPQPMRNGWGTAASPVLHGGRLYYCNDNDRESTLVCLDTSTGKEIWKVRRDEKSNWATPYVWKNSQREEIVTVGTGEVRSYGLDGELLWTLKGMSSITIATPYAVDGLLYISSGYVLDGSRPIYAIKPGASGDISLQGEETTGEFIAWSQPVAAPYNPSTLVYRDQLYVLYDRSMLASFDANNGEEIYSIKRIPNGRAFTSSPWIMNDKLFCLNEDGVTFVFETGEKFNLLHTNPLAEDDMGMATPAVCGDRMLIRTSARVYCIGNSK